MATRIRYIGAADAKKMSAADFTAAGFPGQGDLIWNRANSLEQTVSDDVAILLLAQADFETVDGQSLGEYLGSGFGGRLLQQAANRTGNIVSTAAGAIIVPGCSVTVQVAAKPIVIRWKGYLYNPTVNGSSWLELREGAVVLDQCGHTSATANAAAIDAGFWIPDVKPVAGPHTYDLYLVRTNGTANVFCVANTPCQIAVFEC